MGIISHAIRRTALGFSSSTAFGYFSARTGCNELWRFVPPDAALSYDLESGVDVNDERFMSEFKVFFEKEVAWLMSKLPLVQMRLNCLLKEV
ncbi:hypothetical protein Tco_0205389 [Tanacetum coccineum]